jgi:hypothetical protein
MSETLEKVQKFKHDELRSLLDQCTEPQKKLFNRMYESIDEIPPEKMDWAIQQCERTIEMNKEKN